MIQRSRARTAVIALAAIASLAALLIRFHRQGGPYFSRPDTVYDHVTIGSIHPTVSAIQASRRAAPLLPRGASVTVLRPSQQPKYDTTDFSTAVGLLPYQRVVAPDIANNRPDYVIALGERFEDPSYRLVSSFPEGNLYARR